MSQKALAEQRSYCVKCVEITPELIVELLKVPQEGISIAGRILRAVQDAIPEAARGLRAGITETGNVLIVIESEEFPAVREGFQMGRLIPGYSIEDGK